MDVLIENECGWMFQRRLRWWMGGPTTVFFWPIRDTNRFDEINPQALTIYQIDSIFTSADEVGEVMFSVAFVCVCVCVCVFVCLCVGSFVQTITQKVLQLSL